MTEQGSNFEEKEKTEMMNVQEVARMTERHERYGNSQLYELHRYGCWLTDK